MSKAYDVPRASASYVDATGQTEYVMTWEGDNVNLSGTNLNDGTEWDAGLYEEPERFGPLNSVGDFYAWCERAWREVYGY